jgi:dienelactone hydrolase
VNFKLNRKGFSVLIMLSLIACTVKPPPSMSFASTVESLKPHLKFFKPEGAPPFKTVIYIPGLTERGWNKFYDDHMNKITQHGYAVIALNYNSAHGLSSTSIRIGGFLPHYGAGDIYAVFEIAKQTEWVDKDKIVLWGFSYGGGLIWDSLVLAGPGMRPGGLLDRPNSVLGGLKGVVVRSPFCMNDFLGVKVTAAASGNFFLKPPMLVVIGGNDQIVNQTLCNQIVSKNDKNGAPIELVRYDKAGHSFFVQNSLNSGKKIDHYDQALARKSDAKIFEFLGKALN